MFDRPCPDRLKPYPRLPQAAGAAAATGGGAFVTMVSSANAVVAYAAPTLPRIRRRDDPKIPHFAPCPNGLAFGRRPPVDLLRVHAADRIGCTTGRQYGG